MKMWRENMRGGPSGGDQHTNWNCQIGRSVAAMGARTLTEAIIPRQWAMRHASITLFKVVTECCPLLFSFY